MSDYLTAKEACAVLRISDRQLYYLVSRGRLVCYKVTSRRLFLRSDVHALLQPA